MSSVNALRQLLVAATVVAAITALVIGMYGVAALMVLAVLVHGLGSAWLRQRSAPEPPPAADPGT